MLPEILLAPLVYLIVYLSVTSPRGSFATYYWVLTHTHTHTRIVLRLTCVVMACLSRGRCQVLLGLYYTSTGYGYLVSIVAPPSLAQLVGVVAIFGNAMFAGGMPVLKVLQHPQSTSSQSPSLTSPLCCLLLVVAAGAVHEDSTPVLDAIH